jgi:Na+-transporting NADH:ubiquinone oxidoreductase subunit NqrD
MNLSVITQVNNKYLERKGSMKARYPIEAFALAMVVFSQNMRNALITGILILFITTLGLVIDRIFGDKIPKWSRISCNIILMVALTYSIFQVVLLAILGFETQNTDYILHVFLGLLIAKYIIDVEGDPDYNRLFLEGAGAYAVLLIISVIREFMSAGAVFGFKIAELSFKSNGFSNVIMGFLLTGIGLAILNRIFNISGNLAMSESLLVIIPVVLAIQPFTVDSVSQSVSMIITIATALVLFYSVKKYLVFSRLSKDIKNLPVDMVSMGIIYMILSMF